MQPGFIYEWIDVSNGFRYIGKHRGTIDDGYISSSKILNAEYVDRPFDFQRSILWISDNTTDSELCIIESKYLSAIDRDEFYLRPKCKYYNCLNTGPDPYTNSVNRHGREKDSKIKSERMKGNTYGKGNAGKPKSLSHKLKISKNWKGGQPRVDTKKTLEIFKIYGLKEGANVLGIKYEAFKARVLLAKKHSMNSGSGEIGETQGI